MLLSVLQSFSCLSFCGLYHACCSGLCPAEAASHLKPIEAFTWADFCSVPGSQSSGRRRRAGSLHSSRDHEHRTCLWRKNISNYYLMYTPRMVGSMACTGLGNKDKAQPVSSSCVCPHLQTLGPLQPVHPHRITLQAPSVLVAPWDFPYGLEPQRVKLGRKA